LGFKGFAYGDPATPPFQFWRPFSARNAQCPRCSAKLPKKTGDWAVITVRSRPRGTTGPSRLLLPAGVQVEKYVDGFAGI